MTTHDTTGEQSTDTDRRRFLRRAGVAALGATAVGASRLASPTPVEAATQIGTFYDQGGAVFNVKAYGAVGNGTTDDTAAINATITAAQSAGGGIVFLPQGTYIVKGTNGNLLTLNANNLEVSGEGKGRTVILFAAGQSLTSNLNIFQLYGTNQRIHDLTIAVGSNQVLSGTSTITGINVDGGAFYPAIERVEVYGIVGNGDAGGAGVGLYQPWNQTQFTTTTKTAVTTAPSSVSVTPVSMQGIYIGRVLNVGGENVVVTAVSPTSFTAYFGQNHATGTTITVSSMGNQYARVEDCDFHDSLTACGLGCNASGNIIRNCTFTNIGSTSHQHGIYIQGGYNLVEGCVFMGNAGAAIHGHKAVPNIDASGDRYIGNLIVDAGTYGIVVDSTPNDQLHNPEVNLSVSTTLGTSVTAGTTAWVSPGNMNGVWPGKVLAIGGSAENVSVKSTTATQFLATFANAHATTDTVTGTGAGGTNSSLPLTRYVTIQGNTIRGNANIQAGYGIYCNGLPGCVIIGNVFEDAVAQGAAVVQCTTSTMSVIEGNYFTLNSLANATGILGGANATIRNNVFVNWGGLGIQAGNNSLIDGNNLSISGICHGINISSNLIIAHNTIQCGGSTAYAFGYVGSPNNVMIHDNFVSGPAQAFVLIDPVMTSSAWYNNTMVGGGYIRYESAHPTLVFYNNDMVVSFASFPALPATRSMGRLIYCTSGSTRN